MQVPSREAAVGAAVGGALFDEAPHQHLQIARMCSLETGRYTLRAANTGISPSVQNPRLDMVEKNFVMKGIRPLKD